MHGYRWVSYILSRDGWVVNMKKVYRLYRKLGLQLRNKTPKRRVKAKLREDRAPTIRPNDVWPMDFVHDELATDRKLRSECLNARWFLSLQDACEKLEAWRRHYNEERQHSAMGLSPRSCWQTQTVRPAHRLWERRKTPDPRGPTLGSSAYRHGVCL